MDRAQRIFAAIGASAVIVVVVGLLAYEPLWAWTTPDQRSCERLRTALVYADREHRDAVIGYSRCVVREDPVACDMHTLEVVVQTRQAVADLEETVAGRCRFTPAPKASLRG
jgi:hypothetical protein